MKAGGKIDFKALARELSPGYRPRETERLLAQIYDRFDDGVDQAKFDQVFKDTLVVLDQYLKDDHALLINLRKLVKNESLSVSKNIWSIGDGRSLKDALAKAQDVSQKPAQTAQAQTPAPEPAPAPAPVTAPAVPADDSDRGAIGILYSGTKGDDLGPDSETSAGDDLTSRVNAEVYYELPKKFSAEVLGNPVAFALGIRYNEIKPFTRAGEEDVAKAKMWALGARATVDIRSNVFASADLFRNFAPEHLQTDGIRRSNNHWSSDLVLGARFRLAEKVYGEVGVGARVRYTISPAKLEEFTAEEKALDPALKEKEGRLTGFGWLGKLGVKYDF